MKKLTVLLLCMLLALTPVLAENEASLDGRWLCADIQGNVTENTPAERKTTSACLSTRIGSFKQRFQPENPRQVQWRMSSAH